MESIKCVASSGLLLPEKISELLEAGVYSVTVTINAFDPQVGAQIYAWIRYQNKTYRGEDGAKIPRRTGSRAFGKILRIDQPAELFPHCSRIPVVPVCRMYAFSAAVEDLFQTGTN